MKPQIVPVPWSDVTDWLRKVAMTIESVECIIGVARSGVPIATALSYLSPYKSLAYATRTAKLGTEEGFYDFNGQREDRIKLISRTLTISELPKSISSFLIVDDVATFGDTLNCVHSKLLESYSTASFKFACYAADTARLKSANPNILEELEYSIDIDNEKIYVTFPWNLSP